MTWTAVSPASSQQQRLVYLNGSLIAESEARVSIYDSALMFGDVVFEMTRSFNKTQFRLRQHLERLLSSARYLRIPVDLSIDALEEACANVVAANEPMFNANDEHRLMIDITRGLLGIYSGRVDIRPGVNVIIADFPLRWTVADSAHLYAEGVDAVVPSQRMIPATLLEPKVKNRNRIHYLMANIEMSMYRGRNPWALLLDPDGFVTEGTGANFFVVRDGAVVSPEPRNILRGISRQYVIDLAGDLGILFREQNLEPYDVLTADEAFFSCTPFCLVPVCRFNGQAIGTGSPGPVYARLMTEWSERVGVDIVRQIRDWAAEEAAQHRPRAAGPTPYSFGPSDSTE